MARLCGVLSHVHRDTVLIPTVTSIVSTFFGVSVYCTVQLNRSHEINRKGEILLYIYIYILLCLDELLRPSKGKGKRTYSAARGSAATGAGIVRSLTRAAVPAYVGEWTTWENKRAEKKKKEIVGL